MNTKPTFTQQMQQLETRCKEIFEAAELSQLSYDHAQLECITMYRNFINNMRYPGEEKYLPFSTTAPNTHILNQKNK